MSQDSQKSKVVEHIKTEYGANPEFLWPDRYPSYAVFRHGSDGKWFALVATISSKSLGLKDDKEIDIINLKFDKNQTYDFAETSDRIFPAYHMNKNNWITVVLDGELWCLSSCRRASCFRISRNASKLKTVIRHPVRKV